MLDAQSVVKYLLEGLAVAVAAYYIPRRTVDLKEIGVIALTAAAVFAVLDQFAPSVALGARQGSGFGIGYNITSGLEGFSEEEHGQESSSDETSSEETDDSSSDDSIPGDDSGEPYAQVL
jgi:hypothetical protein